MTAGLALTQSVMKGSREMDAQVQAVVPECTRASEENRMSFVEVVKKLMEAGVESYLADFRRGTKTYYLPSGEFFEVHAERITAQPAAKFHQLGVEAAIREAQANKPDYTYKGFCEKVLAAGCAGYIVSLAGRRAVYFGRTAETHVELFPSAK
jgi:uncharacterized protein YbcV (DUF1398 family)